MVYDEAFTPQHHEKTPLAEPAALLCWFRCILTSAGRSDFVSDQLTDGRRFRILAIVDDCTRECLALVVDTSLSGMRVGRELDRLMAERGRPRMIPDQVRDQRQW